MRSDYLFARPSGWTGVGRLLDLGGTLTEFNLGLPPADADSLALRADWAAVGADVQTVLQSLVRKPLPAPVPADYPEGILSYLEAQQTSYDRDIARLEQQLAVARRRAQEVAAQRASYARTKHAE